MIKPCFSVIIPTYNRSEILLRAINSVLSQTFQDFEIIVVDDASSDKTSDAIKQIQDTRLIYIRHSVNRGISYSRNTGLKLSNGKYITFLDHDDEYVPDRLMKLHDIFQKHNTIDLVYHDYWLVDENQKRYFSIEEKQKGIELLPIHRNVFYILPGCIAIKRECLSKIGFFDDTLGPYEDWDFLIRASKFCRFYYLKEALYRWYVSGTNYSLSVRNNIRALNKILYKYNEELYSNRDKIGMFRALLSSWYIRNNQRLAAIREQFIASLLCSELKYYKRLFHLLVGDGLYYSLRKMLRKDKDGV